MRYGGASQHTRTRPAISKSADLGEYVEAVVGRVGRLS
jgi:hypothetical protein